MLLWLYLITFKMLKATVTRFNILSIIFSVNFVFQIFSLVEFFVVSPCFTAMISHKDEATTVKYKDVLTALQGSMIFIENFNITTK